MADDEYEYVPVEPRPRARSSIRDSIYLSAASGEGMFGAVRNSITAEHLAQKTDPVADNGSSDDQAQAENKKVDTVSASESLSPNAGKFWGGGGTGTEKEETVGLTSSVPVVKKEVTLDTTRDAPAVRNVGRFSNVRDSIAVNKEQLSSSGSRAEVANGGRFSGIRDSIAVNKEHLAASGSKIPDSGRFSGVRDSVIVSKEQLAAAAAPNMGRFSGVRDSIAVNKKNFTSRGSYIPDVGRFSGVRDSFDLNKEQLAAPNVGRFSCVRDSIAVNKNHLAASGSNIPDVGRFSGVRDSIAVNKEQVAASGSHVPDAVRFSGVRDSVIVSKEQQLASAAAPTMGRFSGVRDSIAVNKKNLAVGSSTGAPPTGNPARKLSLGADHSDSLLHAISVNDLLHVSHLVEYLNLDVTEATVKFAKSLPSVSPDIVELLEEYCAPQAPKTSGAGRADEAGRQQAVASLGRALLWDALYLHSTC